MNTFNINNIKNNIKIYKIKQIVHAYIPLLFLIILPAGWLPVVLGTSYLIFAGYFYTEKTEKYPSEYYDYFFINSILTLVIIGGYVNGL